MQHIGKVLRRIREIKGLRQEDLVTPIVSLSTIQKVEAGKRNPSHDVILSMISSLDVSYEEVLYLQNNYNLDERAQLISDFKNLTNSLEADAFGTLDRKITKYLKKHQDVQMKDLQATVRGMICFQETQDFVAPRSIVQDVWNRIEPQNDWLSFDVYLMSHIFYVFEFDSAATNIVRIADYIARYDDLNANPKLRVSFLLNVLTFYRHHNRIVEAEKYADEAITIAGPFILHRLVAQYRKAEIMYLKGHKEKAMEDANFVFECLKTMRLNAIYDDLLIDWEQTLNMDK